MYNSYQELKLLKEVFTSKFDSEKVFETMTSTNNIMLLYMFDIKHLDKFTPSQIMKMMSQYKANVMDVYDKKTKSEVFQRIIDYCRDGIYTTYESKLPISIKDLEWFAAAYQYNVCDVSRLLEDRFELTPTAKSKLLSKYTLQSIKLFKANISDKDLKKYVNKNIDLVSLMKKPTAKQLWDYYRKNGAYVMCREVVVNCYPNDLVVELMHCYDSGSALYDIINKNDKDGLLLGYQKLLSADSVFQVEDIATNTIKNSEIQNYAALASYDKDLVIQAVLDKLGVKRKENEA